MIGLMLCGASLLVAGAIVIIASRVKPSLPKLWCLIWAWNYIAYFVVFLPAGGMTLALLTGMHDPVRDDGSDPSDVPKRLRNAMVAIGLWGIVTGVLYVLQRYAHRNRITAVLK